MNSSIYLVFAAWSAIHVIFLGANVGQLYKEGREACPRAIPIVMLVWNVILLVGSGGRYIWIWRRKRRLEYEAPPAVIFESEEEGLDDRVLGE